MDVPPMADDQTLQIAQRLDMSDNSQLKIQIKPALISVSLT
jgi:hypothetical protein